jgi:hypothetical protein
VLQSASTLVPGSTFHMLSADFRALTDASQRYLAQQDFGVPEVENVMNQVFGANRIGGEAETWTKYWRELNIYEEQLRTSEGVDVGAPPQVCFYSYNLI